MTASLPAPVKDASTELSARRTGMSFQRTRMSADRTLMSVIRTSLSLISFGFTIFQFFKHLEEAKLLTSAEPSARNFGGALVGLGVVMLGFGILYHLRFMFELRRQRNTFKDAELIRGESRFPPSFTLVAAFLLFAVGSLAVMGIAFKVGPF